MTALSAGVALLLAGPALAADDPMPEPEADSTLVMPSLSLPQGAPAAAPTNTPPPALTLDPSMLPATTARTNTAVAAPAPVSSLVLPPEPIFPVQTGSAPAADAAAGPAARQPPRPPPKEGQPLLRVEPVLPRPIGDDEPYPLTDQERRRLPAADTVNAGDGRTSPAGTPQRGSLLDRIISSRSRSYALTNVSANTTNSLWKPLYNTEPDLRDYHPPERPEHIPAQEDANRRPIQ